MTLPAETLTPFDSTRPVIPSTPSLEERAAQPDPSGFASEGAFNQLMERQGAIAPVDSSAQSSPSRVSLMDTVAATYPKTDLQGILKGQSPLKEFTPNQSALVDNILNNTGPGARYQIDPVALKQLQLRMEGIGVDQQKLGQLSGIYPETKGGQMAATTLTGQSLSQPFSTFFGFITNGEKQLYGIEQELMALGGPDGKTLSPADMLRLQLKMSHVSQQLELFTGMLNKGLESSKTVLNTQI